MLVLSRKIGERIHIGQDVIVVVTAIGGGQIRLGIEAPRSVVIRREELLQPRAAAGPDGAPLLRLGVKG